MTGGGQVSPETFSAHASPEELFSLLNRIIGAVALLLQLLNAIRGVLMPASA